MWSLRESLLNPSGRYRSRTTAAWADLVSALVCVIYLARYAFSVLSDTLFASEFPTGALKWLSIYVEPHI